jgi:uncharacterized protein YbjT (DUF2867 family)
MDMNAAKVILVTGATGTQGGAVARALLADSWRVRALTRDPSKLAARELAAQGAELVKGNLDDAASLDQALAGAYGVFSVQDFWEHGAEAEIRQGKVLADRAKAAGVAHFVFSSVGGAERKSGVHHFDSKWEVEQHIAALKLPATILRPVFIMENLTSPHYRPAILGGTLALPLPADKPLQMIAADDIGAFVALVFRKPEEFLGKALEIAGEELTLPKAAEALGRVLGRPVRFVEAPIERVRGFNPEVAEMFQWFKDHGYKADIPALRKLGPPLTSFEAWLRKSGWEGAKPEPQWFGLLYKLKPGTESKVEEIFGSSGRPQHEIRAEDGTVKGQLLRTLVFIGKEVAVRIIFVEGDLREVAMHISRQPQVKEFERRIEEYLAVPRDLLTPEGAQKFFREAGLRCILARERDK